MANGSRFGVLEQGRFADFIAVDASPRDQITLLQDKRRQLTHPLIFRLQQLA